MSVVVSDIAKRRRSSAVKVRDVACRFNIFRKKVRNTTILFIATIAYVMVGGYMFHHVEGHSKEVDVRPNMTEKEIIIANKLWSSAANTTQSDWHEFAMKELTIFRKEVQKDAWLYKDGRSNHDRWNYFSSCFFCLTVISTIGYGVLAPRTQAGRLICIFYAIFGIPLFVIFLAKVGELVSVPLKYLHVRSTRKYRALKAMLIKKKNNTSTSPKEESHDMAASPSWYFDRDSSEVGSVTPTGLRSAGTQTGTPNTLAVFDSGITPYPDRDEETTSRRSTMGSSSSDVRAKKPGMAKAVSIGNFGDNFMGLKKSPKKESGSAAGSKEEEVDAPVGFMIIVLLIYVLVGARAVIYLEPQWQYLDSVYFTVVTFLTIGFGDIAPGDDRPDLSEEEILMRQTILSIFIVIGLVMMSIALNLARDKVRYSVKKLVKNKGNRTRCRCFGNCCRIQKTQGETEV
ncbi:potassium channel subfamily K member 18-like [Saccoglossus kowalevskii]